MSLRTSIDSLNRRVFGRPLAYLASSWNRLAPRERRLLAIAGGVIGGLIVAGLAFLTVQSIEEMKEENADTRVALTTIAQHRDEYLDAKLRMQTQEMRIGNEPPQLAADLEAAAREVGIQIPETVAQPAVAAGKHYLEHSVMVTLRQVDLLSLSKFLSRVETGARVIVVSKLSIKRHYSEGDKLNVSLTATTWERVSEASRKAALNKEKT
jgi:type II secretory pathway component PulM